MSYHSIFFHICKYSEVKNVLYECIIISSYITEII